MKKVIVIGDGGHSKVVIDILQEMEDIDIIGVTSNSLPQNSNFSGVPVLGDDKVLKNYLSQGEYWAAMGIGGFRDNKLREKVYHKIKRNGMNFINAIHPSVNISMTVKLGDGVTIFPGVTINTDVQIGNNVIVATGSTIDHETIIGNHVLISAGVTIGAYSKINDDVLLALGSKVVSGIEIGRGSLIASGSVVVNDIGINKKVFGVPAKEK